MPVNGGWKTGVYAIKNRLNGKVYVGSASLKFTIRTEYHRSRLRKGIHENIYLQRAWNKYGAKSFVFVILEKCSPNDCLKREQYWMDFYRSYERSNGYNICPTAGSMRGTKWTEERKQLGFSIETRAKMSAARKGRKLSPESIEKRTAKQKGLKRTELTKARLSAASSTPLARQRKSENGKRIWRNRSEERRREIGLKISAALIKRGNLLRKTG